MDATFFWELFVETGAPEVYLCYRKQLHLQQERNHEQEFTA